MGILLRLAVLLGLLAGTAVSCGKREQRADLMRSVQARFRHYAGSGDTVTIERCRVETISKEDAALLRERFPASYRFLGVCEVELAFRDHPRAGQTSRLRATARYGWAPDEHGGGGEYQRGWIELPFRFEAQD